MDILAREEEKKKMQFYTTEMDIVFRKREANEYDEDLLSHTREVLLTIPDVATVWNIRKETLRLMRPKLLEDNILGDAVSDELRLTELCLRKNPKSYCAWHHRCWVLDNIAENVDWARELHLCARYLELDERNFHCWDYRGFVVQRGKISPEDELNYSTEKISANFSNYSAWHYRGQILKNIFPDPANVGVITAEKCEQEASLVENAIFTDPNDQSAWFYNKWLIRNTRVPLRVAQAFSRDAASWIVFNKLARAGDEVVIKCCEESPNWEPIFGKSSHIWIPSGKNKDHSCANLKNVGVSVKGVLIGRIDLGEYLNKKPDFGIADSNERISLESRLKIYTQLLEMEPNNKWALLTIVEMQKSLGIYSQEDHLRKLMEIDSLRKNVYADLRSDFIIEKRLIECESNVASISFEDCGLTRFAYAHYLSALRKINLDNNPLGNAVLPSLAYLICCEELSMSNCQITSLRDFPHMRSLKDLRLIGNILDDTDPPAGILACDSLKHMSVSCDESKANKLVTKLRQQLPNITFSIDNTG